MSAAVGAVPSSLVAMATWHVAHPRRRELELALDLGESSRGAKAALDGAQRSSLDLSR